MRPKTSKVTRKVTEATNCLLSTHPIGSNFLSGSMEIELRQDSKRWPTKDEKIWVETGRGLKYPD